MPERSGTITRGEVVETLRWIATELPNYRDGRFEDYSAFAGRLRRAAIDMVARIDDEGRAAGHRSQAV